MNPLWYRDFFHGVAVDLWHQAVSLQHTLTDVDLAWQELALAAGQRVVDAPCGHGRHTVELARRGCLLSGLDISTEALALARQAADEAGVVIDWRQVDLAEPLELPPADAVLTLGNSFGYFGPAGMPVFIRSMARALRPGGRWLIDSGMAAESILPNLRAELEHPVGEIGFRIRNEYLAAESCLHSTFDFTTGGKTETREIWHWVFTVGEIRRMLAAEGLATIALYSTPTREPYARGCPYLYLVCEKR